MNHFQEKSWEHRVGRVPNSTRLSDYCGPVFPILGTKTATKKAIVQGRILLNGREGRTSDYVREGDLITLKGTGVTEIRKLDMYIPIVFEDDHLVIVNKPGGIAANGNRYKTVENAMVDVRSDEEDALPRPIAVHRIDVPTKGLLILGKTKSALTGMGALFQQNKVEKEYQAIVHGRTKPEKTIRRDIAGKEAVTYFETIETIPSRIYKNLSHISMKPLTGRTHQLRIHMSTEGHVIVGDKEYARHIKTILGKGMFLCAKRLQFDHPITKEPIDVSVDLPNRFTRLLQREKERF